MCGEPWSDKYLFLVSCLKGQVLKNVNVEACICLSLKIKPIFKDKQLHNIACRSTLMGGIAAYTKILSHSQHSVPPTFPLCDSMFCVLMSVFLLKTLTFRV